MPEEKWEREWGRLLSRCQEEPGFREGFRAGLLAELRERLRAGRGGSGEADWRRLLSSDSCRPSAAFQSGLREKLLARRRATAETGERRDLAIRAMLSAYAPVSPRGGFSDRLLSSLKERQRLSSGARRLSRRQAVVLSLSSGLAAAGLILFLPLLAAGPDRPPPASGLDVAVLSELDAPPPDASPIAQPALPADLAGDFRADDLFRGRLLPGRARAVGLEVNDGGGWRPAGAGREVDIGPGLAFRPAANRRGAAGLEFAGGSDITMLDDTVLEATDRGFRIRNGVLSVETPPDSADRLFLHFPERDVAVRPGTYLMVAADNPDLYAEDGVPAPRILVGEGGLAVARGKAGDGPLFANHLYAVDGYVSADIPGRRLCQAECEDLEKRQSDAADRLTRVSAPSGRDAGRPGAAPAGALRPGQRAAPPPPGFHRRNGVWVADGYDNRPTLKIRYLSDAYFGLADSRRDLADALSLGPEAIVDGGGGSFFEIHR